MAHQNGGEFSNKIVKICVNNCRWAYGVLLDKNGYILTVGHIFRNIEDPFTADIKIQTHVVGNDHEGTLIELSQEKLSEEIGLYVCDYSVLKFTKVPNGLGFMYPLGISIDSDTTGMDLLRPNNKDQPFNFKTISISKERLLGAFEANSTNMIDVVFHSEEGHSGLVVIEKQSGKVIGIQTGLEQDKPNIIYVLPIKKIMEYKDQGILKKIYSSHFDVYSPHFCNDETIKRYLNSTIRHCNTFIINASNEIEDNYRKFGNIPDERGRNNQIHNYLDYELRLAKSYSQTIQHYEYSSFWSYDDFNNESQDTQRNVRSVADWLILEYAIEYSIENGDPPIFDRYCLIKKIRKIINNADRFISKTKDVLEDFRKLEKNALNNRIMLLLARIFDNFHVLIECNNVDHSESIKDIYINKNTRIERIANSNFILVSYKNNQQKMLNAFFYELFLDVKRIVKLSDTKSIFIGFFNSPGGEYYFNFEKIDLNELNALSNNESGTLWITTELFHFLKSRSIIDVETQPISKKLKNSIIYELKNVG